MACRKLFQLPVIAPIRAGVRSLSTNGAALRAASCPPSVPDNNLTKKTHTNQASW